MNIICLTLEYTAPVEVYRNSQIIATTRFRAVGKEMSFLA